MRFLLTMLLAAASAFAQQAVPRVLIIGDSISMGYTPFVKTMLEGQAVVSHNEGNGGPTTNGLAHIESWLGDDHWDVIHFNFGLHDLVILDTGAHKVPIAQYEQNLRTLVARLQKTGAKLIWATTTPVPGGKLNPPRNTADVPKYNAVARKIIDENNIPVDDLYELALSKQAEIQLPANVHYSQPGYEVLATQVTASILKALDASATK